LTERYIKTLSEKNITNIKIENIPQEYAIFPQSFCDTVSNMGEIKTIDFNFHGSVGANECQAANRVWIFDFISKHFTNSSFYVNTILKKNHIPIGVFDYSAEFGSLTWVSTKVRAIFDTNYFSNLKKSKFCLCPAGDRPWSIRFYEALLCKAIPIVKYSWESWRSLEESKLDYKFYFADDKEFIYREDWAEHNYTLFMKYHTLDGIISRSPGPPPPHMGKEEQGVVRGQEEDGLNQALQGASQSGVEGAHCTPQWLKEVEGAKPGSVEETERDRSPSVLTRIKCIRDGCTFSKQSQNISAGNHCCIACKKNGTHGPRCEKKSF
jgi:hypothetical protein